MSGELVLSNMVHTTGLILPEDLTFEQWEAIGEHLQRVEKFIRWWIGDWILYGERKWGEMYTQAISETDYSYQTCADCKWVSSRIEFSQRRENLSWSHHREVSSLSVDEQRYWLNRAEEDRLSVMALRDEVKRSKLIASIPAAPDMPEVCTDLRDLLCAGDKFGTIYADPAWRYDNQSTRAATDNHYLTMTVEEICALPVGQLAAENAHLHIWTTNAFLPRTFEVIETWGFEYKSMFVWCKPSIGIGNYWRVSHELLLFATKGSAPFLDRGLRSWGEFERGAHSAKPEPVRELIQKASPGPYLELFGRRVVDGWTVWGNQIEKDLFHPDSK